MFIQVNGQPIEVLETDKNVQLLLERLGLTEGRFAVEIDGGLIPKSQLNNYVLTENMSIEVVQAVGGG